MRMRWLVIVAAAFAAVLPGSGSALDSPHDASFSDGKCNNCHALYQKTAAGQDDFNPGCLSCHNTRPTTSLGFPWLNEDQAIPGVNGHSHSWSGFANNPSLGARNPVPSVMQSKLLDGKLQCAVCHDPHSAAAGADPASMHTSIPVGVAVDESGGPASSGKMTLVSSGTKSMAFRVQIQTGGASFIISHDFGLTTPTWFNWSGSAWVPGTATGSGRPFTVGTAYALDDPAVTVSFSAGTVAGNYWDFYVSYPFLRLTNVNAAICGSCHSERLMDYTRTHGDDPAFRPNGSRLFSHPVGVTLNAAGKSYDQPAVLDANGLAQTTGDGRKSNDFVFDADLVRCTTCHAVHNADSNSLTEDAR